MNTNEVLANLENQLHAYKTSIHIDAETGKVERTDPFIISLIQDLIEDVKKGA